MNTEESTIKKLFYSISEVATMFEVNASLIRFWEREFDLLKPQKSASGARKFSQEDIDHFKIVYQLVKVQGLTLEGAKKLLKEKKKEIKIGLKQEQFYSKELELRLTQLRKKLMELKESLD